MFSAAIVLSLFVSCKNNNDANEASDLTSDSVYQAQQRDPQNALRALNIAGNLEVQVFATEPMLKNPTNIDVDQKGRVWVTEAINYRPGINGNPTNPEGDRIVILEDTDEDGRADKQKVFYQGPELNAPIGICVLGNRVLVSQSPYVWAFYDDNNDDSADRKEILFQGIGGEQHDHGVHSFTFGADGKLYFTFGNEGITLKDKNNKVVLDQDGDEIGPKKYQMGMVFRCDPDGSNVECLGHNFRNNFEPAIDSYGTIWQSDNDDDGNRATRINYVMDYGNYGFRDEVTQAGWQSARTNMEDSIPLKHWHLNDPGVVPNLLQTGAGSPSGMIVYEGSLLPEEFRNQMIHCDPGNNVVRTYPVQKNGAGYSAQMVNILKAEKDQWFRPIDVCAAPDGSLIVADWYDPGVGGHQAGDLQRGRIYRIAPKGIKYRRVTHNYSNPAGAIEALQSPNLEIRYHAFTSLKNMGAAAVPELEKLWQSNQSPRMSARAFWALVKISGDPGRYIHEALKNSNPDVRIMAVRAERQIHRDSVGIVRQLINDPDAQVLRECALSLRHNKHPEAADLWATLATKYTAQDRWYLEALGIGADQQWEKFLTAYYKQVPDPLSSTQGRDIIWRARAESVVPRLAWLASDTMQALQSRLRYFRALDFQQGTSRSKALLRILGSDNARSLEMKKLVLSHLTDEDIRRSPMARKTVDEVIASLPKDKEYVEFVSRFKVKDKLPELTRLALETGDNPLSHEAANVVLRLGGINQGRIIVKNKDSASARKFIRAISKSGGKPNLDLLEEIVLSPKYPDDLRQLAASVIGNSWSGEELVLDLLRNKKVPVKLLTPVVSSVEHAWRKSVYTEASAYLPGSGMPAKLRERPQPKEIVAMKGNAAEGKTVFIQNCSVCHQVGAEGFDFGPKLTEIGTKLPAEAMAEAILHPSKGISFGYEGYKVNLKDGSSVMGILSSRTESEIDLKFPGGQKQKIKMSDVKSSDQQKESLMPDNLYASLTDQQIAHVIAYMKTLKKAR